ncbi:MAG: DJ-1 family protein [Zetaproteobacteria bacterium]|nr:MAG: DJ-1 family protein [Zetaproteobacteria bacterium]
MYKKVLVPFTTGVEEIELVAIVDILRRADLEVTLASFDGKPVTGRSNIVIHADDSLQNTASQHWDMLVLPGGLPNADLLAQDPVVRALATRMANDGQYVAAICAAPKTLASFGLLKDKHITSHPSVKESIQQLEPSVIYSEDAVVHDGTIITSRGAGTAIPFALTLVTMLTSKETSNQIKSAILG